MAMHSVLDTIPTIPRPCATCGADLVGLHRSTRFCRPCAYARQGFSKRQRAVIAASLPPPEPIEGPLPGGLRPTRIPSRPVHQAPDAPLTLLQNAREARFRRERAPKPVVVRTEGRCTASPANESHRWILGDQAGPRVAGRCKHCGEVREWAASDHERGQTVWGDTTRGGRPTR